MPYIEVSRIQTHADKINDQLSSILSEHPQIYAKTRDRYKKLAISLLSSVEKIAAILEEDSLATLDNDRFEFSNNDFNISDLYDAMKHASNRIALCNNFLAASSEDVCNSINKITLKKYGQVLEQASAHDFGYSEVNECASVLHKWFKSRFSNNDPTFKYNIAYIPQWITDIVILYGKYQSVDDTCSFIDMMYSWCDSLSDKSNKWATPYEVHNLSKSVDPSSYTMNAVLVGDILMDEVLYQLTESNAPDIVANLECYPVASAVKLKNPSLLPIIRTRLAKRESLVKQYNLTTTERRI